MVLYQFTFFVCLICFGLLSGCQFLQIVDEKGNECPAEVEGEIVVQVSPKRPVGLFTQYVVSGNK